MPFSASRPKPRFRGTLEICLEQLRISLHACHDSLLRAPLLCAPALQTLLRFKMLVTIFAGSETFVSFAQITSGNLFATLAVCIRPLNRSVPSHVADAGRPAI
jgi:hypothetical protein